MKLINFIAALLMLFGIICSSIGYGLAGNAGAQGLTSSFVLDDSEWGYQQQFTIEGSPEGQLIDYQMKLIVHKGNGRSDGQ
jgi:hypothetical protein